MAVERAAGVTLKGTPMTLVGPEIKVGDKAPDFTALANNYSEVTSDKDKGNIRLYLSLPSLDTLVCDKEARRFNEEATGLTTVKVIAVSCDLPPAQKRWCGATGVKNVETLSDHRDVNFGKSFGTLIKEVRQLSRAVFVVDQNDIVQYVEYVPEIGQEPDYQAALNAVKKLS